MKSFKKESKVTCLKRKEKKAGTARIRPVVSLLLKVAVLAMNVLALLRFTGLVIRIRFNTVCGINLTCMLLRVLKL